MLFPRRRALLIGGAAFAVCGLVQRAGAEECDPGASLSRGISFTRQDGSRGLARRESSGAVVIDYVTNRGERTDRRRVEKGVFEVWRLVQESELPVVGSAPPEFSQSFSPKPGLPDPGMTWQGKVKETRKDVGYGDRMREIVSTSKTNWSVSFRCLEMKEVRLSGCFYLTIPVEAEFTGKDGRRSQRWVYFPQLGLGLETRRDGKANGLVALHPA